MHTTPGSDTHFDAGIDPALSMPAHIAAARPMTTAVLMATSSPASLHCCLALITRVTVAPLAAAPVAFTPGGATAPHTPCQSALRLPLNSAVHLPALTGISMGFGMGVTRRPKPPKFPKRSFDS